MRPEYEVAEPIAKGQTVILRGDKLAPAHTYAPDELFGVAREALLPGERGWRNDVGHVFRVGS